MVRYPSLGVVQLETRRKTRLPRRTGRGLTAESCFFGSVNVGPFINVTAGRPWRICWSFFEPVLKTERGRRTSVLTGRREETLLVILKTESREKSGDIPVLFLCCSIWDYGSLEY